MGSDIGLFADKDVPECLLPSSVVSSLRGYQWQVIEAGLIMRSVGMIVWFDEKDGSSYFDSLSHASNEEGEIVHKISFWVQYTLFCWPRR